MEKWMLLTGPCPLRSSASFAGKISHVLSRDGDHMLIGPSSIKLSDRCGVSRQLVFIVSPSPIHRSFIVSSCFENANVLQKTDRVWQKNREDQLLRQRLQLPAA